MDTDSEKEQELVPSLELERRSMLSHTESRSNRAPKLFRLGQYCSNYAMVCTNDCCDDQYYNLLARQ